MGSPSAFLRLAAIINGVQPEPSCPTLVVVRKEKEKRKTIEY
jgi:hypothetical protein